MNPVEGEAGRVQAPEGMRDTRRRIGLSKSTGQSLCELTETQTACTGPALVCIRFSENIYSSQFCIFYGTPECVNEWVSDFFTFLGHILEACSF